MGAARGLEVQHAQQALKLGDRLAAGVGDELSGLARAQRIALEDPPRAARLHDHDAHRVRDDVVHLARDPLALLGHGALGARGAALARARRRLVQLAGQAGAAARRAPGDAERDDEDHREQHVGDHQRPVDRGRGHRPGEDDAQPARAPRPSACAPRPKARASSENQIAGNSLADVSQAASTAVAKSAAVAGSGRTRHQAIGGRWPATPTTLSATGPRRLSVTASSATPSASATAVEHPIDAPGAPHAALPNGRRARRAWPPSREPAVLSSPP